MGGGRPRGRSSRTALWAELRQVGPSRRAAARGGALRGAVGFHSGRNARKRRGGMRAFAVTGRGAFPPAIRKERTKVDHLAPLEGGARGDGITRRRVSQRWDTLTYFLEGITYAPVQLRPPGFGTPRGTLFHAPREKRSVPREGTRKARASTGGAAARQKTL